jgi:ESS family glutamate:Na+ symporter
MVSLQDFGLMSLLIVAAHLLRSWIRPLQDLYIPTAILAGFLGLVGGEQCLDWLPFARTDENHLHLSTYPGILISVLFATMFLGMQPGSTSPRDMLRRAGDTFFYNMASELAQYTLAMLAGLTLLGFLFPQLDPSFAILLPAGFCGGHGTVAAMGQVFVEYGFKDALSVGFTFATVGLLAGVVCGIVLVNVATRRGWTRLIQSPGELNTGMRDGFASASENRSLGRETVSPIALESLVWHLSLVLAAVVLAVYTDEWSRTILADGVRLPQFALAMLYGGAIQLTLHLLRRGDSVDRQTTERIGSTVADYLVAFGIASVQISVVVEYAVPLLLMSVVGIVGALSFLLLFGRRVFQTFWFERSLFVFGWNTGVIGTGVALLRIVDPRLRTKTLEDFGLAYFVMSFVSVGIIVALPLLAVRGHITGPTAVFAIGTVICLLASRLLLGWSHARTDEVRPGEEIVSE